jgi:hypothetical protein
MKRRDESGYRTLAWITGFNVVFWSLMFLVQ